MLHGGCYHQVDHDGRNGTEANSEEETGFDQFVYFKGREAYEM